ncbi:MAG: hypothetical protein DRI69_09805 [Bacteroidetes bacterium]|nr:MAG: hypothetical protein DRI69_09805 [Bacteroidota bacterium]
MRGTSHLLLSSVIAVVVARYLFAPIFAVSPTMAILPGYAMVAVFLLFAAVGSVAPDADMKHTLIRKFVFLWFFLPYWILALIPMSFIFDFSDEKILTRINRSLFKPKHRGVMHSLIGLTWSTVVVYIVTAYLVSHYPAMAAAEGFLLGYLLHLIEDAIFTSTPIKPFVTDKIKIGG